MTKDIEHCIVFASDRQVTHLAGAARFKVMLCFFFTSFTCAIFIFSLGELSAERYLWGRARFVPYNSSPLHSHNRLCSFLFALYARKLESHAYSVRVKTFLLTRSCIFSCHSIIVHSRYISRFIFLLNELPLTVLIERSLKRCFPRLHHALFR